MSHEGQAGGTKPSCHDKQEKLVQLGARPVPAHWKSVEERRGETRVGGEFPGGLPMPGAPLEASRRDVLSLMGFTLGASALAAGCRAPVQHAVPLPIASDEMVPGVANLYATTCGGCAASCALVVKQRDGRPIKIEGNDDSPLFGGGACATGQATVLSLYDDARLRAPTWMGRETTWAEIDAHVAPMLQSARTDKRKVVLLTGTITSPSTRALIDGLQASFPNFRHVVYEPLSLSAMRTANERSFGAAVVPHYRFDKARVIVGLEADFLGAWLSPVEFARQYVKTRTTDDKRSFHVQVEAGMSVTGSNADLRIPVPPSELGAFAVALYAAVARRAGAADAPAAPDGVGDAKRIDAVAEALWAHRGASLVVSGSNDVPTQTVVNAINGLLGNVGATIDLDRPSLQRQGDDAAMAALLEEMDRGEVHTLLLWGVNPAYDYPTSAGFLKGLGKVTLSVSFADRRDETAAHVQAVCPDHHFLESWGDAEPVQGHYSLRQPLIAPLFSTRAAQESLLRWSGQPEADAYKFVREFWKRELYPRQKSAGSFDAFWDGSLQRGVVELPATRAGGKLASTTFRGDAKAAAAQVLAQLATSRAAGKEGSYELHLTESVAMRDGSHANNPWLQELPDPITKVTWGNVAAIAPATAAELKLKDGDLVSIKSETAELTVPVFVQPGQQRRTLSVALGYGRTEVGKAGRGVGVNAFPLSVVAGGTRRHAARVAVSKSGKRTAVASTQMHSSMEGRPIAQETTVAALMGGVHGHGEAHEGGEAHAEGHGEHGKLPNLWNERLRGEHSWGMAIDLDACTGCSACVVACQAENNIPVVGVDQIRRQRSMHWMRIDRYYAGSEEEPSTVHQPMMCQHCQHAPCETVCPVVATTTSSEGINQQVYNRCIGTRYCANNCPYKVRRFNWHNYTSNPDFDFHMESPLGRLVLNPDVTVRTRGVMEKCSLCVQRIQLGKNQALQEKREIADGDVRTACQQTCPTGAIVFGDLKDPESRVSKLMAGRRAYEVLEDLGTRPNVGYLKKIRPDHET